MSKVYIHPTEFLNVRTGGKALGVRVFDAYGEGYDGTWDAIPNDDIDLIKKVIESKCNSVIDVVDTIEAEHADIQIGNNSYSWNKVKHLFERCLTITMPYDTLFENKGESE